jgi:hypothetical protein
MQFVVDHATNERIESESQKELRAYIKRTKTHGLLVHEADFPHNRAKHWMQQEDNLARLHAVVQRVTANDAIEVFWDNSTEPRIIQRTTMQREFPASASVLASSSPNKIPTAFHGQDENDGLYLANLRVECITLKEE